MSDHSPDDDRALVDATLAVFGPEGELAKARPGYRHRASQCTLAERIAATIAADGTLIAEAGTGIGKTFAYLVPALLSGKRVLISTGTRQLQDQLFQRDLESVRTALGVSVQTAVLKGRANYVCPLHLARNLTDGRFKDPATPGKLRVIERFAAVDPIGDRAACTSLSEEDPVWQLATSTRDNCLGQDCPELRQCPLMKARQRAQKADVLVVNHHLFCADLALKDDAIGEFLPDASVLIFDEAHQLPDTATDFFGESVSTRQLIAFGRDALRAGIGDAAGGADWRACYAALELGAKRLRLALPEGSHRLGAEALRALPAGPDGTLEEAVTTIDEALAGLVQALTAHAERSADLERCRLRAIELRTRLDRWATALWGDAQGQEQDPGQEQTILWGQTGDHHAALQATPLSVAARFAEQRGLQRGSWIFVSATLAIGDDLRHFSEAIGLPDAERLTLPSPFDYASQAGLWLAAGVGPTQAQDFPERVAARVWPLVARNRGRAFVLCTTLRATRLISAHFKSAASAGGAADAVTVLTQGDAPRHELLKRFRETPAAVLVGSAGFWEGVDVVGNQLSLVVIDKLPFAPPDDPIQKARGRAIERAGRSAFGELSLPAAAMALKQGAGRLIRSERDRGLLVICDDRLISRSYGRQLLAAMPPFRRVESLEEALACLPESD